MRDPCVYLLASHYQGTLYCGVTSDLIGRVWQHRSDLVPGFTHRFRVHQLVWYEQHATMDHAIAREKAIKEAGMTIAKGREVRNRQRWRFISSRKSAAARRAASAKSSPLPA